MSKHDDRVKLEYESAAMPPAPPAMLPPQGPKVLDNRSLWIALSVIGAVGLIVYILFVAYVHAISSGFGGQ